MAGVNVIGRSDAVRRGVPDGSTSSRVPDGSMRRRGRPGSMRRSARTTKIVLTLGLVVISLALLAPFAWLFTSSVKTVPQLSTWPPTWWPEVPRWQNYAEALTAIPYLPMAMNSIFLATITGVLTTLSSSLCGFGFARLRGRGKNILFGILIAMMMTPPIITLIPTYLMFARVNLVGTYWPWVFWGLCGSAGTIFLFRQHFATIPKELEEAARIDGASLFRIYWQIFMPLAKPLLVTAFVATFAWVWGDYITPALMLTMDNTTLAVGLAQGYPNPGGGYEPRFNLTAAGAVMYVLPAIALFLSVQRVYVQGSTSSAVKG